MRRLHLRGRENIAKRVLIHAAGFNMGLMMRVKYGMRKPRSMAAAACALFLTVIEWLSSILTALKSLGAPPAMNPSDLSKSPRRYAA